MDLLCEFGCGQKAVYQFKSGKWACSSKSGKCPSNRKGFIVQPVITNELCSEGCGKVAEYKKGNSYFCCYSPSECSQVRRKQSLASKTAKPGTPTKTCQLCSYGCGRKAKFELSNGKLCCSSRYSSCPVSKSSLAIAVEPVTTDQLCYRGCGNTAVFKVWDYYVCSRNPSECSKVSEKISKSREGRGGTFAGVKLETELLCSYGCGKTATYQFNNGKLCCSQTIKGCESHRNKLGSANLKVTRFTLPNINLLLPLQMCSYGCGSKASTLFKNGKWCCSERSTGCIVVKNTIGLAAKEAGCGGLRPGSSRGKSGWYKGIWCDSSYELAWVIFHLEHGTPFARSSDVFKYIYDGEEHEYHPDFKVFGFWVEVKGYSCEQWVAKQEQFPYPDKLVVLFKDDMPDIFSYVVGKYGEDFVELYEGNGAVA